MAALVGFAVRTGLTLWLLVLVYQGSRVALVVVLALLYIENELSALIIKWTDAVDRRTRHARDLKG